MSIPGATSLGRLFTYIGLMKKKMLSHFQRLWSGYLSLVYQTEPLMHMYKLNRTI